MNTARIVVPVLATSIAYAQPAPGDDTKSPELAVALSLGTTTAGVVALAVVSKDGAGQSWATPVGLAGAIAFVVGPTIGHAYADDTWNIGLALRVTSTATGVLGGMMVLSCIDGCQSKTTADIGAALFLTSGFVYGGATLYEIATAGEAAHHYNRNHVRVTPAPLPGGGGLVLAGRF